jgi:hypothetical protein
MVTFNDDGAGSAEIGEATAWDAFAAAELGNYADRTATSEVKAEIAAKAADALILERRRRYVGAAVAVAASSTTAPAAPGWATVRHTVQAIEHVPAAPAAAGDGGRVAELTAENQRLVDYIRQISGGGPAELKPADGGAASVPELRTNEGAPPVAGAVVGVPAGMTLPAFPNTAAGAAAAQGFPNAGAKP